MKKRSDELIISLNDIFLLWKKKRKKIRFYAFLFASFAFLFALLQPIQYTSSSSFRDRGHVASPTQSIGEYLLGNAHPQESVTITVLKSRTVIENTIKRLGLQVKFIKPTSLLDFITQAKKNLITELNVYMGRDIPLFEDVKKDLIAKDVEYLGEFPLTLFLEFQTPSTFSVKDESQKLFGEGRLGLPFQANGIQFLLLEGKEAVSHSHYKMILNPLKETFEAYNASIKAKPDKLDKELVRITHTNSERHLSSQFLNQLMKEYQEYLKAEDEVFAEMQLAYLHQRQEESFDAQDQFMKEYASEIATDLSQTGFASTDKEMAFLAKQHHDYHQKLLSIDLEILHLQEAMANEELLKTQVVGLDLSSINPTLRALEELRQDRDSLSIALQEHIPSDALKTKETINIEFERQMNNLDRIQQSSKEIQIVIDEIKNHKEISQTLNIFQDPNVLVKLWCERMLIAEETSRRANVDEKAMVLREYQLQKGRCLSYLTNLLRLYDVHSQLIHERLSHHYDSKLEFQGIDLESAKQLYATHSKEVGSIESELKQHSFIIKELEKSDFEISSLSSILKDSVSSEIILKSTELSLILQDEENRSVKELTRVKDELTQQKKFLKEHLLQVNQVLELRKNLIEDKCFALQGATLELVHQKISLLQKHVKDFLHNQLINLSHEKKIIEKSLVEVNEKMSRLPKKWASEELLNQRLHLNKTICEEITRLVENKNISHHLDFIKASPLDAARPPTRPDSPHIALITLLGALLGVILSFGSSVISVMIHGVETSEYNLRASHQFFAGEISSDLKKPYQENDLSTLRGLISHFKPYKAPILILQRIGFELGDALGELYQMQGMKVVIVDIAFDQAKRIFNSSSLWDYLEGRESFPKVELQNGIYRIESGGSTKFSFELLSRPSFKKLLKKLQEEYDVVLCTSHASAPSSEMSTFLHLFECVIVELKDEKLYELQALMHAEEKRVAFVKSGS